jgi:predicted nucleotidyltransferase
MVQRNDALLKALVDAGVEFVLVGGVAANLHGSSHMTKDLDVVTRLSVENCSRILVALSPYAPRFYQSYGKPAVTRTAAELAEFKNLYWDTAIGRIDLLGTMPPVGDFDRVLQASVEVDLGEVRCRVVALDDLIAVKAFVGRPKDRAVEFELRAIKERLENKTNQR